jgi:hypothetical protein
MAFGARFPKWGVFGSPDIGEIMALPLHSLQDELDRRLLRFGLWSGILLLTALATALLRSAEPRLLSLAEWRPLALVRILAAARAWKFAQPGA